MKKMSDTKKNFIHGVLGIMPLAIAVMPWGVLAGSLAIQTGLNAIQAFAMSLFMFAGAAQLVSLGLVSGQASLMTIYLTIFFLTSQHLIYALNFRNDVSKFPLFKRIVFGFLLTDELFAVGVKNKSQRSFAYLFGAGLCFYIFWLIFSLFGIVLAHFIPNLSNLHLDFSVVALLILIIVPMIKNLTILVGVVITIIFSLILEAYQVNAALIISGLCGMFASVIVEKWQTTEGD